MGFFGKKSPEIKEKLVPLSWGEKRGFDKLKKADDSTKEAMQAQLAGRIENREFIEPGIFHYAECKFKGIRIVEGKPVKVYEREVKGC